MSNYPDSSPFADKGLLLTEVLGTGREVTRRTFVASLAVAALSVAAGCSSAKGATTGGAASGSATTTAQSLVIATGGAPKPFSYVGDDGKPTGYDIAVISAALDRLPQYSYSFEVTDFPSIFGGLDSDKYQIGVNNFSYNEDRAKKYLYTETYFKDSYVIAVRTDDDSIRSLEDLGGKSTDVQDSTTYASSLQAYNEKHADNPIKLNFFSEPSTIEFLRDVEEGRTDFEIIDGPIFDLLKEEQGFDNLKAVKLSDEETNQIAAPYSYALVGSFHEQLRDDLNAVFKELVADGTIKKISEQFFSGKDYTPYDKYQ